MLALKCIINHYENWKQDILDFFPSFLTPLRQKLTYTVGASDEGTMWLCFLLLLVL